MTSKTLKSAVWLTLVAGATAMAAQGVPGPGDGGGGGGGNKPPTEVGNSLSVPAIMAKGKGAFTALTCGDSAFTTLAAPLPNVPVHYPAACALTHDGEVCVPEGDYYVQRDSAWQAPCAVVSTANAMGAWGDNLAGDAMLKVGSPIRVELVLWDSVNFADESVQGYKVIKLEPAELDRLSAYGHLAADNAGTWEPTSLDLGAIVHDPEASLTIQRMEDGVPVGAPEYDGAAGGEINATGKIVYGYNLRVAVPGTYRLTYTLPNVAIDGCEETQAVCGGNTASLDIEVVGGGGGGGGKGGGQGGGKPIKPGKPSK